MGKYKKIILIVCVVSLLLVTVCIIPASAATVYKLNINQPNADEYSGYIEYLILQSDGSVLPFVTFWQISNVAFTGNTTGTELLPVVDVTVSSGRILLSASFKTAYSPQSNFFTISGASMNGYGSISYWNYSSGGGTDAVNLNAYIGNGTVLSYKVYGNFIRNNSSISAGTMDWSISYSENSNLYDGIMAIANSLQSGNSAIIDNQNENTQEIIQNQQESTDKILNGGSEEPPYSAPDTSNVDEMHETEDYIIEQTSAGRNDAVSVFSSVGNVLSDTSFSNGMLFVSSFFNEFFGISWLNSIGSISLALGLFAFIIGSVVVVGRVITKRKGGD